MHKIFITLCLVEVLRFSFSLKGSLCSDRMRCIDFDHSMRMIESDFTVACVKTK